MKRILILLFVMTMCINIASAESYEENFTDTKYYLGDSAAFLKLISLKYEPYPVNPGDYFTLWIKAENVGGTLTENAVFELLAKYPFSLDSNEDPIRQYGKLSNEEPIVMEFKVRVDDDAVEGLNEIDMQFKTDADNDVWSKKEFSITVDDAQTDFDLVIQEVSESEVSIAIANVGKNVAYSVIVRIPEQDYFEAVGTDGQMVGNLEDGDYTLVGFQIQEKRVKNANTEDKSLRVQIDYTDEIGERRKLLKRLSFDTGKNNGMELPEGMTQEEFRASRRNGGMVQPQKEIYQQWWLWVIVVAVLYILWKGFRSIKIKKEEREEKKEREERKRSKR